MPAISTYVIPVLTWFLGIISSIFVVWYTSRSTQQREHELKTIERREARIVRRNEFQRENLLNLQEAATDLLELTIASFTESEEQGVNSLARKMKVDARLGVLLHRVVDEEVRAQSSEFRVRCATSAGPKQNRDDIRDAARGCSKQLNQLNASIRKVLLELDSVDDRVG